MKRVVSFSFPDQQNESTLMSNYFDLVRQNTPIPGWSIDGVSSADTSPAPTPGSSPRHKKKSMRLDANFNIEEFASLRLEKEADFSRTISGFNPPSIASLEDYVLSSSSLESTPHSSTEDFKSVVYKHNSKERRISNRRSAMKM